MKIILFIAIFLSFLFFSSCTETPQIVSDVCSITQEICHYSTLICEQFDLKKSNLEKTNQVKFELTNYLDELKIIYAEQQNPTLFKTNVNQSDVIYKLTQIRNDIKKIYVEEVKTE